VDVLQRLQAVDVVLALVWAAVVAWGLNTGLVRQIGMLVAVYAAALVSGSAYREAANAMSQIVGADQRPQLEFIAYVAVFVLVLALVTLILWRAYPASRFKRGIGIESIGGAIVSAVWGVLLLIALVTMLRFYTAVPWNGQEASQQGIARQVQQSQLAPVLEFRTAALWQIMAPWFPAPVTSRQ
jgi:uncharacterized membrane protein required for colicin V production